MECPRCNKAVKVGEKCSCGLVIETYPDCETPLSIYDDELRVDWYQAGEGYYGDYNPENPEDDELLRFDVYRKEDGEWIEVEDASYCTCVLANTDVEKLVYPLYVIFKEYKNADLDGSVKKLGEMLSWISLEA